MKGKGLDIALLLAFGLGLAAVAWVGAGYLGGSPLALAMTGLIVVAYGAGAAELRRLHLGTGRLQAALHGLRPGPDPGATPPELNAWLARLPAALRHPVRLRIEGERTPLPMPTLTPYLVGLLVLLGMLGTFLGLVVTLKGTVLALQGSTDLVTVRNALTAPVQGLGLAFGTSVAGVAASAMLGLMSALCRRARLQATQQLDTLAAQHLRHHSRAHQREQTLATLHALQAQTLPLQQLPQVLEHLQAQALQASALAQASHDRLLLSQDQFQQQALARNSALTQALAQALEQHTRQALQDAARLAADTLQPLVAGTLAGVGQQVNALQQAAGQQLARLQQDVGQQLTLLQQGMAQTLEQQLQSQAAAFERQQSAWLQQLAHSQAEQQAAQVARTATADQQRLTQWAAHLAATAQALQQAWQQAGEQAQAQQAQVCHTLAQTAQGLQDQAASQGREALQELSRLATAAAQAPQAAAELVLTLRQQLSDSLAQDQAQLAERGQLMTRLNTLLDSLQQQAQAQRQATEGLLAAAAQQLQQAGARLEARVEADTGRLAAAAAALSGNAAQLTATAADVGSSVAAVGASAADVGASAVDMASLAEAFGAAVQLFGHSSSALGSQLQQIDAALARSMARSDEQLAYYVAQAREIVDLSLSSQQQIVQDLRQLAQPQAVQPPPARLAEPA